LEASLNRAQTAEQDERIVTMSVGPNRRFAAAQRYVSNRARTGRSVDVFGTVAHGQSGHCGVVEPT
jgi:hypothetical protein